MRFGILIFALFFFASSTQAETNTLCIQEFLSRTIFDPGPKDGLWGKKTKNAINELFSQANKFKETQIKKDDAQEICKILESEQNLRLLEIGQFKKYPINITETISEEFSNTKFDFSTIKVNRNANYFCSFTINYKRSDRAVGKLQIENGIIKFQNHKWFVGQASKGSEIYLKEEANLRVSQSAIYGIIPYLSYVGEGETAKPIQYVTLGDKYKKSNTNTAVDKGIMGSHGFLDKRGSMATLVINECSDKVQKEIPNELPVIFEDLDVRVNKRNSNFQTVEIDFHGLIIGSEVFDSLNIRLLIDYASNTANRGLTELFRIQLSSDGIMPEEKITNLKKCKSISWNKSKHGLDLFYLIGNESYRNSCILEVIYPEKRNIIESIANSLPEILKLGLESEPGKLKDILHVFNDAKEHEL